MSEPNVWLLPNGQAIQQLPPWHLLEKVPQWSGVLPFEDVAA